MEPGQTQVCLNLKIIILYHDQYRNVLKYQSIYVEKSNDYKSKFIIFCLRIGLKIAFFWHSAICSYEHIEEEKINECSRWLD